MFVSCFFLVDRVFFIQTFGAKLYPWLSWLIPVFVSVSTFGSLNGITFAASRLTLTGATEGQLPAICAYLHSHLLTPIPALLFQVPSKVLSLTGVNYPYGIIPALRVPLAPRSSLAKSSLTGVNDPHG